MGFHFITSVRTGQSVLREKERSEMRKTSPRKASQVRPWKSGHRRPYHANSNQTDSGKQEHTRVLNALTVMTDGGRRDA